MNTKFEDEKNIEYIKFIAGSRTQRLRWEDELEKAENSLAYWWYRCLRASNEYKTCCLENGVGELAETYEKFGNVFNGSFAWWWQRQGRNLFIQKELPKQVRTITKYGEIRPSTFIKNDKLIIEVPLSLRKQTAIRQIGRELKKAYEGRDVDIQKSSTATVKFVKSKVRMSTVQRLLEIDQIRKDYPHFALAEIGKIAGIQLDIFRYALPDENDWVDQKLEDRRLAIAVSRYSKQAHHLIYNAARGIFPVTTPYQKTE